MQSVLYIHCVGFSLQQINCLKKSQLKRVLNYIILIKIPCGERGSLVTEAPGTDFKGHRVIKAEHKGNFKMKIWYAKPTILPDFRIHDHGETVLLFRNSK